MIYRKENLTLSVTEIQNPDIIGEGNLEIPLELFIELLENSCAFLEFSEYDFEEIYNEHENDIDSIVKHFKEEGEDVIIYSADAIISVYEYCLSESDRNFDFNVESENISWVIHDLLHATYDAAGCTIYVAADIERERILESLTITAKEYPNSLPGWDFLETLEVEFKRRFKENLDLEEFKYINDSEYEY
jgi:hypothetical protein